MNKLVTGPHLNRIREYVLRIPKPRSCQHLPVQFDATFDATPEQDRFHRISLNHELQSVNYIVSRGGWIDRPPMSLDFSSCEDGPILYVNEVVDKKVNQIWKWDSGHQRWVPIRQGEIFRMKRERVLELDRNQIPRLRATRKRRGVIVNTGADTLSPL